MAESLVQVSSELRVLGTARTGSGPYIRFDVPTGVELTVNIRHPDYDPIETLVYVHAGMFLLRVEQQISRPRVMGSGDGELGQIYHTVVDCSLAMDTRGPTMLVPTGRRMIQL